MPEKKEYYVQVAETLIEKLKQGTAPWQKPWDGGTHGSMPMNPSTNKRYRGGNALFLMAQGYDDPRWLSYRQAENTGAQVRRGEHGTPVIYWKFEEKQAIKDETGKPVLDGQSKVRTQIVRLERPRTFISRVFNAQQIDGLPELVKNQEQKWFPLERAETLLANSGAKIEHRLQPRAFYSPQKDQITLPDKSQFSTAEGYYATALHELGHWTGHAARLNRDLAHPFGSEEYAKEELRAEIGSFMLGQTLGAYQTPENHASYVGSWIKALQEDPRELFRAASDAEKILDYVMAFELKQEQKVVQEETKQTDKAEYVQPEQAQPEQEIYRQPEQTAKRRYLAVDFADKNEVKELGGKWDRLNRAWYVPQGADESRFEKWFIAKQETPVQKQETRQEQSAKPREYLVVSYLERALAKSAGARWDAEVRSWYVGPDAAREKLTAWLPGNKTEQMPALMPHEEFANVLRSLGCRVEGEHPIMDGKPHRIATEEDTQGMISGFYVVHLDGHPAGYVKNNRSGEEVRWKSLGTVLTQEQQQTLATQCVQNRQARMEAVNQKHDASAQRIMERLRALQPVVEPTLYHVSKGLEKVHSGIFIRKGETDTALCVPAQDVDGKIWTMQYINSEGIKRFAKDSRKEGCFHPLDGMDAVLSAPALVICEGYATASTVSEHLGFATITAFDAGNLVHVAKALHTAYPDKAIVIAGDDDLHLQESMGKNPGREKAQLAAQTVGGEAVFPVFAPGEKERAFTDFNDLGTKSALGHEAVARQMLPVLEKACAKQAVLQEQRQQEHHTKRTL